jgi:acetyl esterase/lipase
MKRHWDFIGLAFAALLFITCAAFDLSRAESTTERTVPARVLPTPNTVSPQLQKIISRPVDEGWRNVPSNNDEWVALRNQIAAGVFKYLPDMRKQFGVTVEPGRLAGVPVFFVRPDNLEPKNQHRVLMHLHGGGYVFNGGEAGTVEAVVMAHYAKTMVISVDYRMPPEFPFPAALDDSVAVWKEIIKSHSPNNIAIFGTSAGGGLTLATVLKLKELHLPLPGAISPGTPWSDLSKTGDTYFTNEMIDNVLGSYDGGLSACARLYANGHDLKEPLISPVYGEFTDFPPAILITGTRDMFLSNTVRVHQLLRKAGVEADLLVFEGQSHAQYLETNTPESAQAYEEIARFLDRHLGTEVHRGQPK